MNNDLENQLQGMYSLGIAKGAFDASVSEKLELASDLLVAVEQLMISDDVFGKKIFGRRAGRLAADVMALQLRIEQNQP